MHRLPALLLLCATSFAASELKLSPAEGKAPLTVSITGPEKLVKHGKGTPRKWVGCGFVINWGDGTRTPDDLPTCADGFKHVYKAPGTYQVKAALWHPGPNDAPRTDWSSSATVKVQAP